MSILGPLDMSKRRWLQHQQQNGLKVPQRGSRCVQQGFADAYVHIVLAQVSYYFITCVTFYEYIIWQMKDTTAPATSESKPTVVGRTIVHEGSRHVGLLG